MSEINPKLSGRTGTVPLRLAQRLLGVVAPSAGARAFCGAATEAAWQDLPEVTILKASHATSLLRHCYVMPRH